MSQGADILKMAPSQPPPDFPLSNGPHFKVSEGTALIATTPERAELSEEIPAELIYTIRLFIKKTINIFFQII